MLAARYVSILSSSSGPEPLFKEITDGKGSSMDIYRGRAAERWLV